MRHFEHFCLLMAGLCDVGFERWPCMDPLSAFLMSWRGCYTCRWGGHLSSEMIPASDTVKLSTLSVKCGR